jgi:hypothetical protein
VGTWICGEAQKRAYDCVFWRFVGKLHTLKMDNHPIMTWHSKHQRCSAVQAFWQVDATAVVHCSGDRIAAANPCCMFTADALRSVRFTSLMLS